MKNMTIFDHEKLDVYQLELAFVAWVSDLLNEIKADSVGLYREASDQLDRASLSALLNTAEGNGKRQGRQRAKFFDDARGSAVECSACLDALVAKGLIRKDRIAEGKAMLLRIVGMLTKLVERFDDSTPRVREGRSAGLKYERPLPSKKVEEKKIEDEHEGRARGGKK